jgi:hypothetical protein
VLSYEECLKSNPQLPQIQQTQFTGQKTWNLRNVNL